jgi:hypothetical protein
LSLALAVERYTTKNDRNCGVPAVEINNVTLPVILMPTLVLSTWSLPASKALADSARQAGWRAYAFDERPRIKVHGRLVFYGGTDKARAIARQFHLALLEPPFELLAKLPLEFRRRAVECSRFGDLSRLKAPTFVKPADALNKSFDPGI